MSDLVEFLRARLNEDEAAALRSRNAPADALRYVDADEWSESLVWMASEDRVLREVKAKRRIISEYERYRAERRRAMNGWDTSEPSPIIAALASVYADHPDYQREWNLNLA